jgi:hypothetical protein
LGTPRCVRTRRARLRSDIQQLMWVAAALAAVSECAGQTAREPLNIEDPAVARGCIGTRRGKQPSVQPSPQTNPQTNPQASPQPSQR